MIRSGIEGKKRSRGGGGGEREGVDGVVANSAGSCCEIMNRERACSSGTDGENVGVKGHIACDRKSRPRRGGANADVAILVEAHFFRKCVAI